MGCVYIVRMASRRDETNESSPQSPQPPPPTAEALTEFKQFVSTWMEYDTAVRKLQSAVSERRAAMRVLQKKIVGFMKTHGVDALNTRGGRIVMTSRQTRAPIRVHDIQERLNSMALQGQTTLDVSEFSRTIFEQPRAITHSDSLRRIVPKVTTLLDI